MDRYNYIRNLAYACIVCSLRCENRLPWKGGKERCIHESGSEHKCEIASDKTDGVWHWQVYEMAILSATDEEIQSAHEMLSNAEIKVPMMQSAAATAA